MAHRIILIDFKFELALSATLNKAAGAAFLN